MYNFTQKYYDFIMEYTGLNQRSAGLLSTTEYTGFTRWHLRNHKVYDDINECITKYIANMYEEYATPKAINSYNYSMPNSIIGHINSWYNELLPMKKASLEMYNEACEIGDFFLADKFKELNKIVCNEIFSLRRVLRRIKDKSNTDIMIVNKLIHDYFESNMDNKHIDFSL